MTGNGQRAVGQALRGTVALLSAAVLALTGYGWSVYAQVSSDLVTSDALGDRPPAGLDEPFTALLVGLDSRTDAAGEPLPPAVLAELRAGEDEGQFNTDTIILLRVPAGPDARASAISIPRDSFVRIADGSRHKINSAYRRGMADADATLTGQTGPARERAAREAGRRMLVATVEDLTGVTVDHFAEINLAGFVEITEAIGGVPVCLNAPVREARSGIDLPAGVQVVSGGEALAFVRQRHDLPDGDLDRVTRQQAFLAGFARTALDSVSDPARLDRLVQAVTRYVVLDRDWNLDTLAAQFRRASGGDITFRTIPTGAPDLSTPVDGVAVEVDPATVRQFVAAVIDGEQRSPAWRAGSAERRTPAPASPTPGRPITAATVPCVD